MKKYTTLLIDLDDTLIDKDQSIYHAYREIMKMEILDLDYNQKEAEAFLKFDTNYWKEHEKNGWIVPEKYRTSKAQEVYYLRTERFIRFFEEILKITSREYPLTRENAALINETYMQALGNSASAIDGAKDFLSHIPKGTFVVVATNGAQKAAEKRLELAGLKPYINQVVSSEVLGVSKPSPDFFRKLFQKYPQIKPEETLMVGDDLSTDIKGAKVSGIDSCWFNRHQELPESKEYTYVVKDLRDVLYAFQFSNQYEGGNALKELNKFEENLSSAKMKIKHRNF